MRLYNGILILQLTMVLKMVCLIWKTFFRFNCLTLRRNYKKDLDEIEEALNEGWITNDQYNLAFLTFNCIYEDLLNGTFKYLKLSTVHRNRLV